jgi:hypothetical protein
VRPHETIYKTRTIYIYEIGKRAYSLDSIYKSIEKQEVTEEVVYSAGYASRIGEGRSRDFSESTEWSGCNRNGRKEVRGAKWPTPTSMTVRNRTDAADKLDKRLTQNAAAARLKARSSTYLAPTRTRLKTGPITALTSSTSEGAGGRTPRRLLMVGLWSLTGC